MSAENSDLSSTTAELIRWHRERLHLNREELARRCALHGRPSLTAAAIVNIETGRPNPETGVRRREITIDELVILEKVLGVRLLEPAPECPICGGKPPEGFQCQSCGASE